jgi:hypothetical protein
MQPSSGHAEPLFPKSGPAQPPPLPSGKNALVDALKRAESLEPHDRMRLMVELWDTLPRDEQAAFLAFGIDKMNLRADENVAAEDEQYVPPAGGSLWEALFDPAKATGLYSAPKRFDLATIFVVTAAYSLLFAAMTPLDFGVVTKVAIGVFVAIVGATQAFYQEKANPRGVSIVAGAISLSIILAIIGVIEPRLFDVPFIIVIVIFGMIGGAIGGYLAGGVVAGVFLLADVVRKWHARRSQNDDRAAGTGSAAQSESPWTD